MGKNDFFKFYPENADFLAGRIQEILDGKKFLVKRYNLENPDPDQLVEITTNTLKRGEHCKGVCAVIVDKYSATIQIATTLLEKDGEELFDFIINTKEMIKTPTVKLEKREITISNLILKDRISGKPVESELVFEIIN